MAQVKCPVCGEMLEKDGAVPYKSRYYHVECFESHFKEDVVVCTPFDAVQYFAAVV